MEDALIRLVIGIFILVCAAAYMAGGKDLAIRAAKAPFLFLVRIAIGLLEGVCNLLGDLIGAGGRKFDGFLRRKLGLPQRTPPRPRRGGRRP